MNGTGSNNVMSNANCQNGTLAYDGSTPILETSEKAHAADHPLKEGISQNVSLHMEAVRVSNCDSSHDENFQISQNGLDRLPLALYNRGMTTRELVKGNTMYDVLQVIGQVVSTGISLGIMVWATVLLFTKEQPTTKVVRKISIK